MLATQPTYWRTRVALSALRGCAAAALLLGMAACAPGDESRALNTLESIRKDLEMDRIASAYSRFVFIRYQKSLSPLDRSHWRVAYEGDYDFKVDTTDLARRQRIEGVLPKAADWDLEKVTYIKRQDNRILLKGRIRGRQEDIRIAFLEHNSHLLVVAELLGESGQSEEMAELLQQSSKVYSWTGVRPVYPGHTRYLTVGGVQVKDWSLDDWLSHGFTPPGKKQ